MRAAWRGGTFSTRLWIPDVPGVTEGLEHSPGRQAITYRDLLTHMSGLAPEGSPNEPGPDYFSLKTYLSPTPTPGTPPLGPRGVAAYSNVGFALFRLLLPNIVGLIPTTPPGQYEQERAFQYATAFQQILNDNQLGQLGITGPSQGTPPGNDHAFMYFYPSKCPAGVRHTCTGDTFVLSQSGQGTLDIQANWPWCENCGVLAYSGSNTSTSAGKLAAGGPHQLSLKDSN